MTLPVDQYPLAFAAGDPPSFDNFVPGPNREAVAMVQRLAAGRGERYLYLGGAAGTGKTHLLAAAVRVAGGFYLSPAERGVRPEVTERLDAAPLVGLDEAGAAAGRPEWERALFRLFVDLEDAGARLVVAGRPSPARLGLALPDLASRLASGPVLHLRALPDAELEQVLRVRARARGFELSSEVTKYLLDRERRDPRHLLSLLDRLDRHSLAARRRITIPFVRDLLAAPDQDRAAIGPEERSAPKPEEGGQ